MTHPRFDDLVIPAPPYRMARPVARLAMADGIDQDAVAIALQAERQAALDKERNVVAQETPAAVETAPSPDVLAQQEYQSEVAQTNEVAERIAAHPTYAEDSALASLLGEREQVMSGVDAPRGAEQVPVEPAVAAEEIPAVVPDEAVEAPAEDPLSKEQILASMNETVRANYEKDLAAGKNVDGYLKQARSQREFELRKQAEQKAKENEPVVTPEAAPVEIVAPEPQEEFIQAEPEVGQYVEGKGWVTGYGEGDAAVYSETKPGEKSEEKSPEPVAPVEEKIKEVPVVVESAPPMTLEDERASVERAQGISDEARAKRLAEYDAAIARRDAGTSEKAKEQPTPEKKPTPEDKEAEKARVEQEIEGATTVQQLIDTIRSSEEVIVATRWPGKSIPVAAMSELQLHAIEKIGKLPDGQFLTGAFGIRKKAIELLKAENPNLDMNGWDESGDRHAPEPEPAPQEQPAAQPVEAPKEKAPVEPEPVPEPGSVRVNLPPTPEIEAARAAAERSEQEVRGGRMAAETDRRLRSEAEGKIPSPAEVGRLRAAKEHIIAKPENRSWLQTIFDRVHAWQTRADIVERAHWQSRAQSKFEFAQKRISEFEKKLENAGPLSRMWYASRLKDWQSYAMTYEGRVAKWSTEREVLHERHAEYIRGVVERYDKVLTPYRERSKDLSERLSVQASVREKLVEHRKDALMELAKAEVAAKRGRWFKEPAAKKAMADIKEQLREIDRRIGDSDTKAQRYRYVLTDAELKIRSLEGKKGAVEEKLKYPEFGKLNIPAHEPLSSVAPTESAPVAPEVDPSEVAWKTEDLIKQWNALGLQPIDDPASLIENVRDEVRRLNLRGAPKAKDLKAIVLKYLDVTTRQQKKVLEGDWKRFLEKAKPKQ